MPAKIRDLGKFGVVTDQEAFDLPPNAFTMGVNVRFRNGHVSRGPIFRTAQYPLLFSSSRFLVSSIPNSGNDTFYIGYQSGQVSSYNSGSETNATVIGYTTNAVEATWTSCHLADLIYINRSDRVPWVLLPGNSTFSVLPNWNPNWSCSLLRSYNSALVALNVTKYGTTTQTMVKTSSFALAETVPASWDQTSPTTNATENILSELEGPIVDAQNLGSLLIIYGSTQAWYMQANGSEQIYNYAKLPFNKGSINANCSIEIAGRMYVFGPDDIWSHDANSEMSICDGAVRDYIFSSLNANTTSQCFIVYNNQFNELHFCYQSGDAYTAFSQSQNVNSCNRQAVYNLGHKTWTFDDLPLVHYGARGNLAISTTYASTTSTYTTIGGSYQGQSDGFKRVVCYLGAQNTLYNLTTCLYAFDPNDSNAFAAFPAAPAATAPAYLERNGIDLDEFADADLQGYKQINYVIPQGRIDPTSTQTMNFVFGAADTYNDTATLYSVMSYDGVVNYKLDFGAAGRFLYMNMTFSDYKWFTLSGVDLDLQITGER